MARLTGRTCVVTGAAHGIGAAIVRRAAQEGAGVAVVDLDGDAAAELAEMVREGGGTAASIASSIVNVTSAAGLRGTIGQVNYAAAKAGIIGLTKAVAREVGQHGIRVNGIAPGAATKMTERICTDERFRDQYLQRIPLGRWADPDEVAPAFAFLLSDEAAYVTGSVLCADGGLSI